MKRREIDEAAATGKWRPHDSREKAKRASTPAAVGAAGGGLSLVAVLAFIRAGFVAIVAGIIASVAAYWRTYTRDRKKHVEKGLPR